MLDPDLVDADSRELVVSLDSVTVALGGFPALLGITLEIRGGELVFIKGPNGAGKSTLLRLIAGLVKLNHGSAKVAGLELPGNERALRLRVGLVSHQSHLYEDLTVKDNLELVRAAFRLQERRVLDAAELFGLAGRLGSQKVTSLSAGQKKRVSLCALVMKNPPIWLLDEPHSSLDVEGRDLLDGLIREANRRNTVVILASHEEELVTDAQARTLHLVGGRVVAQLGGRRIESKEPIAKIPGQES